MQPNSPLDDLQNRIEYQFTNVDLLKSALTHSSSAMTRVESNERLEFLGDAVLGLVVCQDVYERYPEAMEGELTKIKSAVVSRKVCAQVAESLRITDAMLLGQGMEPGDALPRSLAAGALESLIAAIYLDGGLEAARHFIIRFMLDEILATSASEHQFNYKSQLQQYAQRTLNQSPSYELLDEKGPDHAKCFEVAVCLGYKQFAGAWGPSKKEAEQKAAMIALRELGVLHDEEPAEENAAINGG